MGEKAGHDIKITLSPIKKMINLWGNYWFVCVNLCASLFRGKLQGVLWWGKAIGNSFNPLLSQDGSDRGGENPRMQELKGVKTKALVGWKNGLPT